MRLISASALVGAALLLAGCGGSGSGGGSGTAKTASLAPKDAGLWLTVDTDRASGQWKALDTLLAGVPGAKGALDSALSDIGSGDKKLSFERDVQPAVGGTVVVVLPAGAKQPVLLVKPADKAKLTALLADQEPAPVTGEQDGWTVVAQTRTALDAYTSSLGKGTLGDADAFQTVTGDLPSESLATLYVDPKGLAGAADTAAGAAKGALSTVHVGTISTTPSLDPALLEKLGQFGIAVTAGDHVLTAEGSMAGAKGAEPVSFEPTLLRQVPGDALVAMTLSGSADIEKQVNDALTDPAAKQALAKLPDTLGVSFAQLLELVKGQGVLYLRPGLIIPELSVVLTPPDPATALKTLDAVGAKLAASQHAQVTQVTRDGRTFQQVSVSIVSIAWGRDGDKLVVTTSPGALGDFDATGSKLVDTARFKTAAGDVGLGDTTSGFVYVDVKGLAPLVSTLGNAAGSAASDPSFRKALDALSAVQSFAENGTVDGSTAHFKLVLRTS